ncbi:MAG TPA: radical SAM protein [Candidatus Omnitrophota bacterium]|nr:radical SAM protein [Candidatus Omnitrophota bacterium]
MKAEEDKKICVKTGCCCSRRFLDAEKQKRFFLANDYLLTEDVSRADVIIFNSCGVTELTRLESLGALKRILDGKPERARLFVGGCLPGIWPRDISGLSVDGIFTPQTACDLDSFFRGPVKWDDVADGNTFNSPKVVRSFWGQVWKLGLVFSVSRMIFDRYMNSLGKFFLRINHGCLGRCSYCGHRFSTAGLRSKPLRILKEEFREGLRKGYRSFVLSGEDTGCWGMDSGDTVFHLLEELTAIPGDCRIAVNDFNPRWLVGKTDRLKEILQKGKIVQLQLPVISGSGKLLEAMNRGYSREELMSVLLELRARFPRLVLLTQMIVGFPGETEADVRETEELLKAVRFDYAHFFAFTPIPGTEACELPGRVDSETIRRRKNRLENLQCRIAVRRLFSRKFLR